ncbi:hypothetical protein EDF62_3264 [Leucobacter luti]|uniref:Uncharacterized protein n=1 Tax=Leucobacter luti TaxID=340320 RepID=A0A4R6RRS8_9MICO|nr:hypothetical protein EDF62_3264 [Leucobacter luti]
MAKCVSWRYTPTPQHASHLPGECRECWEPCTEKVVKKRSRCAGCTKAIIACPDHRVRRALLSEENLDRETVEMLAQDQYPMIAVAAQQMLADRWGVQPHDPGSLPAPPGYEGIPFD